MKKKSIEIQDKIDVVHGCRLGTDAVANLRAASNSKPEVLDWSIQLGPQGGILHALLMYQGVLFRGALPNQLP